MAQGTTSNVALGLAVAGVAALFIISGIQKKSLANVLSGDIGELTPAKEAIAGEPEPTPEEAFHNAPNPLLLGNGYFSPGNHGRELAHGIEVANKYREELEKKVRKGQISEAQGIKLYKEKYPYAGTWSKELKELVNKR